MLYVAIASKKGGVGKSTTAIHLSHWLSLQGFSVLLVDSDSNRTATAWEARARASGTPPKFEICTLKSMPRYLTGKDYVVLDTGGDLSDDDIKELVEACNLVIVPLKPDIDSAAAGVATADAVKTMGGAYRFLVSDYRPAAKAKVFEIIRELEAERYEFLPRAIRRGAGVERASLEGSTLDKQPGSYRRPWLDYEKAFNSLIDLLK